MSAEEIASALNSCNLSNLDIQDKNGIANVFTDYFANPTYDSDTDSEFDMDNSNGGKLKISEKHLCVTTIQTYECYNHAYCRVTSNYRMWNMSESALRAN